MNAAARSKEEVSYICVCFSLSFFIFFSFFFSIFFIFFIFFHFCFPPHGVVRSEKVGWRGLGRALDAGHPCVFQVEEEGVWMMLSLLIRVVMFVTTFRRLLLGLEHFASKHIVLYILLPDCPEEIGEGKRSRGRCRCRCEKSGNFFFVVVVVCREGAEAALSLEEG